MESAKPSWNLLEIKRRISQLAENGTSCDDVVAEVSARGVCAPVEFECLDYKETIGESKVDRANLVRHCAAMHNTFGGYLLIGVRETGSDFEVIGVQSDVVDCEALRAQIKEYTGRRVQVVSRAVPCARPDGTAASLLLLVIPKRLLGESPVHFLKDGPGDNSGKPIFYKESVYYRDADETIEAKGPRLLTLIGGRANPYLCGTTAGRLMGLARPRTQNNLPDRNFICPRFVGRADVIDRLYHWLADDLSFVKLLAGEGGLGKSSIAFEFAAMVSLERETPFEQIIWLTAKQRQFSPQRDDWLTTPETHYDSYETLLTAICEKLATVDEDLGKAPPIETLRRVVRAGLSEIPSLLIVDDIDSLDPASQRKAFELGMLLAGTKSRLLLTTRNNLA